MKKNPGIFIAFWLMSALAVADSHPRIASTSPALTELLFQLGREKDLVATASFSEFPEAARALPTLGPLFAPSMERTISFQPNWILFDVSNPVPHYERSIRHSGFQGMKLDIHSLDSLVFESERLLRRLYGEADAPVLRRLKRCLRALPKLAPYRFLVFVWLNPPVLAGHSTLLSDLLTRTGGTNALPREWAAPYPQVSLEWILNAQVDRIYVLMDSLGEENLARATSSDWWPARPPKVVPILNRFFSRSSLTPLQHLAELGLPVSEECRGL